MRTSDKQQALLAALFEARKAYPKIDKSKEGQAGNRKFKYAPMEDVLDAIKTINETNNLLITQPVEGHNIITRLDHVPSGEWREATMPVNEEHANMQSYGIELTYRKRYAIQGILGIITEEDTDGADGSKKRKGIDHTDPRNANGTLQGAGGGSGRDVMREAFSALQPEIQDQFRKAADHADKAMPNVISAINIMEMAMDNWPDEDRSELKKGIWFLLDSKTRTAISKEQKK